MENLLVKFKLKLNIDQWGKYKKGDEDFFYINIFDERNGLVRFSIDKWWDIISYEIENEDIVSLETAKLLEKINYDGLSSLEHLDGVETIIAPTLSSVQKWFRDRHKIMIMVKFYDDGEGDGIYFICDVSEPNTYHEKDYYSSKIVGSYEEALEIGIVKSCEFLLENL